MVRDITIGQYYPAKSVVHRLVYFVISDFVIFIPQYFRISGCDRIPRHGDPNIESSFFIYCERVKTGGPAADDHGII